MSVQGVFNDTERWHVETSDCLPWLATLPEASVDLVFGSPPYADARTYDDGTLPEGAVTVRDCREWVDWMLDVTAAAVRVSKGLVLWVVSGVQRDLNYWPCCEGLSWLWWERGNHQWRPVIWHKVDNNGGGTGIPGSGGEQWLRNDWEYILAFKREGWLPFAENTACGHEPVYSQVGGEMSNRNAFGVRADVAVGTRKTGNKGDSEQYRCRQEPVKDDGFGGKFATIQNRDANGKKKRKKILETMPPVGANGQDGEQKVTTGKPMPKVANPGNFLEFPAVVNARVGGGHMGSKMCHKGEAPFPEKLPEFFIRSWCPENGIVLDPFCGTGTTASVAIRHGRRFLGADIRSSQVELTLRRLAQETPLALFEGIDP